MSQLLFLSFFRLCYRSSIVLLANDESSSTENVRLVCSFIGFFINYEINLSRDRRFLPYSDLARQSYQKYVTIMNTMSYITIYTFCAMYVNLY